ncbi:MAG: terpene cyclase/mutase family protein [Polyangia bacterium]
MSETSTAPASATRDDRDLALCERAVARGLDFLASQQEADGAWRGDYGGPMFLLPMYVAARHIGQRPIEPRRRDGMLAYLSANQQRDGSFGLHVEGSGCQFTTVLCYVAFRLLGLPPDDERVARARAFIHAHGTALACASWGKFTLALLNLYEYDGLQPVLPELWLLPASLPFHPSRLWCHCRQVYLPMAHLYGMKARMPADELMHALRREIYDRPYDSIRFAEHRNTIAPSDVYEPASAALKALNFFTGLYERMHARALRERSLTRLLDHIEYEDRATQFIRIGPVNAVLNTLVHHFQSPNSEVTERSFATLEGYLWDGHDGTKMNGYNSTALWDTAFAAQAMLEAPVGTAPRETLQRAHAFVANNQVLEDLPDHRRYYRHQCRGGWPFSDRAHGWPITDCTAEGLTASLMLEHAGLPALPEERILDAVKLLLTWQNRDGGWATYEKQRGGRWLDRLNPAHVFGDIMVDHSYAECTAAALHSLALCQRYFAARPDRANDDLVQRRAGTAIRRGERFLRNCQRADGSWEGSWGVCFTYGTWFGVRGLLAAGAQSHDAALQRACQFLFQQQNADGGWGESGDSCRERRYLTSASHAVNTAWALLTLVMAGEAHDPRCERAAGFLVTTQLDNGDWPRQTLSGVFNKTALINYENYRRIFPVWALARFAAATG